MTDNMLALFKGFVPVDGKQCTMKFKGKTADQLLTFDQAKDLDGYAGILNPDSVLIDIDDKAQSEVLMNIVDDLQLNIAVNITTRGRHFIGLNNGLFASCKTNVQLACGLTADIKVGLKDSYVVLKSDGVERETEWDIEDDLKYQQLPKWLAPVSSKTDFFHLEPGEGRNSALYSYILTLTNAGYSKDESKECLELINKYVLPEPLDSDELETIMRDDAFPAETFYNGKQFLHNNFALFLKNNENIKRINGQLHVFRDGCYISGMREIEARMINCLPGLKSAQRTEVYKYLELLCRDETKCADAHLIAFNNGIYDLSSKTLIPFTPEVVITNKIPWDYNPDAYSELADNTLNALACGDPEVRALLEECIGSCFYRSNTLAGGKAFILTGEKNNGKSTYLTMLRYVLGEENVCALDLEAMDERFSTVTLAGKLANIGDDISDDYLQGKVLANFKKIVTGNQIKGEYKGFDAFFFEPYTKLLFSANEIPRMKDKTGAVLRRLVIVPLNGKFVKGVPGFDPEIIFKLKSPEVAEYLIQIGVKALLRVLENQGYTESVKVRKATDEYEVSNNPILSWLVETDESEINNQPQKEVYRHYRAFCLEQGFTEMSLSSFSKELSKRCSFVVKRIRIDGKQIGFYQKVGEK